MMPIIDFHCDLLSYLEEQSGATAHDLAVRCSIPQLRKGGVRAQVLAIYTDTHKGSSRRGMRQAEIFRRLPEKYPSDFEFATPDWWQRFETKNTIGIIPAIENASALCDEDEPLRLAFERLDQIAGLAYISMTWNSENRFGGPPGSSVGLKGDGKELLAYLDGRKIAVDLSHASDVLAHDILTIIDLRGYEIPIVASHSNCRAVADQPRNLPDELICEIIRRRGIIGMNFIRHFIHDFRKQIDHFMHLGAENSLVIGADYFFSDDPNLLHRRPKEGWYFPEYQDAGSYPGWIAQYGVGDSVAYRNAKRFLTEVL